MNNFKKQEFLLDPCHIESIITKINPPFLTSKPHKIDSDRLLYSQLVEYAGNYLSQMSSELNKETGTNRNTFKELTSHFFIPLFEQMISLSKRECNQKASLLKLLLDFFKEGISSMQQVCQQKLQSLTAEYYFNLREKQQMFQNKEKQLQNKIKSFEEENEKKWKTFYLIVRDNRVLRRQKGKLLRVIQQQRVKIANIHDQMIRIARQNEKNKLLVNYQSEKQSLNLFLQNLHSIAKLEQFMKDYPKLSKKILKINLHQLQVIEQNSLQEKVEYIIKTASEFEEIYDQYQDMIDIAKPNRILFNISTQTESQDVPISTKLLSQKNYKMNKLIQTYPKPMQITSETVIVCIGKKEPYDKYRRRQAAQLQKPDINKIINSGSLEQIKHKKIKVTLQQRVFNIVIPCKMISLSLALQSQVINLNCSIRLEDEDNRYPSLPTKFKLNKDISRSKEYVYKKGSQRSSRFSGITNQTSADENFSIKKVIQSEKIHIKKSQYQKKNSQNNIKAKISHSRFSFQAFQNNDLMGLSKIKLGRLNTENFEQNKEFDNFGQWNDTIDEGQEAKIQHFHETVQKEKNKIENIQTSFISKTEIKDKLLDVPKTSMKKIRKSGFGINKQSSKQLALITQITNRDTVKIKTQSSLKRKSEVDQSMDLSIFPQTQNKMIGASKEKNFRPTVQTKIINLFSQQYSRVTDKLLKVIFNQRRQISEGKITFEQFIKTFMTNQYGSHLQFILASRVITSRNEQSHLAQVFDFLLSSYESIFYLQIMFALFAKILSASGSCMLQIDSQKASMVQAQILRTYIGQQKLSEIGSESINICSLFFSLQQQISTKVFNCQLYHFLQLILPNSQNALSYQEIRQILGVFLGEQNYFRLLISLKQYCKGEISPFSLCLFALKEKWMSLVNICTYIESKSKLLFGPYDDENSSELILMKCSRSENMKWILTLFRSGSMRILKKDEEKLKNKYLGLLFVKNEVEKILPISQSLLDISLQHEILLIKNGQSD